MDVSLGFMDDFTISAPVDVVSSNVEEITSSANETGLLLNPTKCEIISFDDIVTRKPIFKDIIHITPVYMIFLDAPVLKCPAKSGQNL